MASFLTSQMDFIFLFYGLAFVLLGAVCLTGKKGKDRLPWHWLGLFGLVHGAGEWMDLLTLSVGDCPTFALARTVVMTASFIFLAEFARAGLATVQGRAPSRLVLVPLLLVAFTGLLYGGPGLNATARYALGLTGGCGAAAVLLLASRRCQPVPRRWLMLCGLAMGVYALSTGAVVPRADFFPASMVNHDSFLQVLGFPVQLLRGVLALVVSVAFWKYYQAFYYTDPEANYSELKTRYVAWLPAALLVVMVAG